jgi:hypothetical protein
MTGWALALFEVLIVVGLAWWIWRYRPNGRGSDRELDQQLRSFISPWFCGLWFIFSVLVLSDLNATNWDMILIAGPWLCLAVLSTLQRLRRTPASQGEPIHGPDVPPTSP